jgi:hypothetical protein
MPFLTVLFVILASALLARSLYCSKKIDDKSFDRYVYVDPEKGIYLGHHNGYNHWSERDSKLGCIHAVTFSYKFNEPSLKGKLVPVKTTNPKVASIDECVTAGLPRWDPNLKRRKKLWD